MPANEFRSSDAVVHEFHNKNQEATDFAMLINNLNAADHEPMKVRAPEEFFQNESPIVSERKTHKNEAIGRSDNDMILIDDDAQMVINERGTMKKDESSSSLFSRRRIGGNIEQTNHGELEMLKELKRQFSAEHRSDNTFKACAQIESLENTANQELVREISHLHGMFDRQSNDSRRTMVTGEHRRREIFEPPEQMQLDRTNVLLRHRNNSPISDNIKC